MMYNKPKNPLYRGQIEDCVHNFMVHSYIFEYRDVKDAYFHDFRSIVDQITSWYLIGCDDIYDGRYSKWGYWNYSTNNFQWIRLELEDKFGEISFKNFRYHIYEHFSFIYNECIKCEEHCGYCSMTFNDVEKCMERKECQWYADACAPTNYDE